MWAEFLSARLALQPSHTLDLDAALTYPPGTRMRILDAPRGAKHPVGTIVERILSTGYGENFKDPQGHTWRFWAPPGTRWEFELA
jgi:hypothetical protein